MPELSEQSVSEVLKHLEGEAPFAEVHIGWDEVTRAVLDVQAIFVDLYLNDPSVFWATMVGLTVLVFGLGLHIAWSLAVVVRAFRSKEEVQGVVSQRHYPCLRDARDALIEGGHRRSIDRAWRVACAHFRVPIRDVPSRQRVQMPSVPAVERLYSLHRRACYGASIPTAEDAESALHLVGEIRGL